MSDPLNTRKVVLGIKNAQGAYVKQEVAAPASPAVPPASTLWEEPPKDDISLDDLLARAIRTLWREVRNLEMASHGGQKLKPAEAAELRDNLKLLMDLKKREKDLLDGLTDDELEKLAEEIARKRKGNDIASSSGAGPRPPRKTKKGT